VISKLVSSLSAVEVTNSPRLSHTLVAAQLRVLEGIESLVSVTNEWQTHLSILLCRHLFGLCSMHSTVVLLWDLINWEVADIYIRREFGFEWSPDLSKLVPNHATEERVLFNG
jgi:hypothetical protein